MNIHNLLSPSQTYHVEYKLNFHNSEWMEESVDGITTRLEITSEQSIDRLFIGCVICGLFCQVYCLMLSTTSELVPVVQLAEESLHYNSPSQLTQEVGDSYPTLLPLAYSPSPSLPPSLSLPSLLPPSLSLSSLPPSLPPCSSIDVQHSPGSRSSSVRSS